MSDLYDSYVKDMNGCISREDHYKLYQYILRDDNLTREEYVSLRNMSIELKKTLNERNKQKEF